MKRVDIVFIQDWENEVEEQAQEGVTVPEWGDWDAIAEYLARWDFGQETDDAHTMTDWSPASSDWSVEVEVYGIPYTLTYNEDLRYVGLVRRTLASLRKRGEV